MLQNPNHEGGEYQVARTDAATFEVTFNFSGASREVSRTQLQTLNAQTGAVETHPLRAAGPDQASAELRLDAGDVWLFKYDTGAPFALGPR